LCVVGGVPTNTEHKNQKRKKHQQKRSLEGSFFRCWEDFFDLLFAVILGRLSSRPRTKGENHRFIIIIITRRL